MTWSDLTPYYNYMKKFQRRKQTKHWIGRSNFSGIFSRVLEMCFQFLRAQLGLYGKGTRSPCDLEHSVSYPCHAPLGHMDNYKVFVIPDVSSLTLDLSLYHPCSSTLVLFSVSHTGLVSFQNRLFIYFPLPGMSFLCLVLLSQQKLSFRSQLIITSSGNLSRFPICINLPLQSPQIPK